jgi:hypothetical protein
MSHILDCQTFPCIDYFKMLIKETEIKIFKYERFRKMTFHNRFIVAGANGLISLTVPIRGGREQKAEIGNIMIDNSVNWQIRHWKSIISSYNKAPFFEYYQEQVRGLIFSDKTALFDFNVDILNSLSNTLGINCKIKIFDIQDTHGGHADYQSAFLPRSFQDGRNYWKPKYSQVFQDRIGFQPNLSILDLIFCEGPNTLNLLQKAIRDEMK